MPCPKDYNRVEKNGRARAGSQKLIQTYVNYRREELDTKVLDILSLPSAIKAGLRWVSPLAEDNFNEYQDAEFLDKLQLSQHANNLGRFWPKKRGPCWDALAIVEGINLHGALLVEAKSHVSEMVSSWKAKSPESRDTIQKALEHTAMSLGISPNPSWVEKYYQSANRLAHLYFLRNRAKVQAWLIDVYFTDDTSIATPTSLEQWRAALKETDEKMGLGGTSVPFRSDLFVEAIPKQ